MCAYVIEGFGNTNTKLTGAVYITIVHETLVMLIVSN